MKLTMETIVAVATHIQYCTALALYASFFTDKSRNRGRELIKLFLLLSLFDGAYYLAPAYYFVNHFTQIAVLFCYYLLLKEQTMLTALFHATLSVALTVITVTAVGSLYLILTPYTYNEPTLLTIAVCATVVMASGAARLCMERFIRHMEITSKLLRAIFILTSLLFLIAVTALLPMAVLKYSKVTYALSALFLLILPFGAVVATYYISQLEQDKIRHEAQQHYLAYTKKALDMQETTLNEWNHYYFNLVRNAALYIRREDLDGLKQYVESLDRIMKEKERHEVDAHTREWIRNTLHMVQFKLIAGLLYQFYADALLLGIRPDFTIEPVTEIYMPEMDLFKILAIFLNNAIEEIAAIEDKNMTIQFSVSAFSRDEYTRFIIKNSLNPVPREKKGHSGKGRAYALKYMNVYRNLDIQAFSKEEGIYTQAVTIKKPRFLSDRRDKDRKAY